MVTDDDIDWESLKGLPEEMMGRSGATCSFSQDAFIIMRTG